MTKKPMILLAGGGTAGHVNPLLATASYLISECEIKVLGTSTGLEKDLVPAAGYDLLTIEKIPFPRSLSKNLFKFPVRSYRAYKKVKNWIRKYEVRVVVGYGGYVSTPAYLAARKCDVPVVIHEQNARPGLANILGARWAKVLALTFANTRLSAKKGVTKIIGLPLRPEIQSLCQDFEDSESKQKIRKTVCEDFGFDPNRPVLLVTGGSLGAARINQAFLDAFEQLPPDIQVLHLTGKGKAAPLEAAVSQTSVAYPQRKYVVKEYLLAMHQALACADLVVCRSGAGTVVEMTALGIPAIYVPLPLGNGEQQLNAQSVIENEGAILVDNQDFTGETVIKLVVPLLNDTARLKKMSAKSKELAQLNAGQVLADLIKEQI